MSLKELILKRSAIKGRITKFKNYLAKISQESLDTLQLSELKIKLSRFERLDSEFSKLQGQIETLNESELDDELDTREEFENEFTSSTALALDIVSRYANVRSAEGSHNVSLAADGSNNSQEQAVSHEIGFKLPLIQISKFDGTIFRWLEFRDTFKSLIHDNARILPVHKFHYLNSYLEGEAARVVGNLEVCAANYDKAWGLLCERYNNKRQLISNHLDALFNIELLSRESEHSLRALIDNVNRNLRALASLGQPTEHWDTLIIHMVCSKVDNQTSMKWEEHRNTLDEMPSLNQFNKFLKDRADVLESFNRNKAQHQRTSNPPNASGKNRNTNPHRSVTLTSQSNTHVRNINNKLRDPCVVCKGNHAIYSCPTFLNKTPELRLAEAQRLGLCINCLMSNHRTRHCYASRCRECKGRHATLLHRPCPAGRDQNSSVAAQSASDDLCVNFSRQSIAHVMLSTVLLEVSNPATFKSETVRALLDSGSQSSFLSKRVKDSLNLESIPTDLRIVGIGNTKNNRVTERCFVKLRSLQSEYQTDLTCFILPQLTTNIPKLHIDRKYFSLPSNTKLADPDFNSPAPIDALIGADLYWEIMGSTIKSLGDGRPYLCNSQFGWIISGPIELSRCTKQNNCNFAVTALSDEQLDNQISKFWEVEELPQKSLLSDSEKVCEQHFKTHTTRLESGRFSVRLPLKDSPTTLGNSLSQAKKRFFNLEKRFRKQPELKQAYREFINEYIDLGHCSELTNFSSKSGYFLCHHPIIRLKSESTRLRVVFDGTAPSSNGVSINSLQLIGPTIQDSLLSIILRFRLHKYVLTGDIEKMYRQIEINEKDRNLQLILWREDENEPLRALQLNTVTYGFASASFLSTRCLYQLGEECVDEKIKTIIQHDFYYDDLLTGADTKDQLSYILNSIQTSLKEGCFNLRKFRSNLPCIFQNSNLNLEDNLCLSNSTSALGLGWDPKSDILHFSCQTPLERRADIMSKRQIVSNTCKIFDPLGLISPSIILAKILVQKIWTLKLDWDQPVPPNIIKEWDRVQANIDVLNTINIPRYVLCDYLVKVELHSFCDASMSAYGACIYLKSTDAHGRVSVNLLCSKSRVAPSGKPMTIPRLELSAALLAARLCVSCLDSLRTPIVSCVHWCDSSVVLGWINTSPSKLKMFVANRVAEICESTRSSSWRHVPTESNPADLISRGVDAIRLKNSNLWWNGPGFLRLEEC
ncbi:uncharacterized protein LOC128198496 [Bicyclus anynana]|nr:uncharacterized protein LOC128198496 [Bicyclus anynana]